MKKMIILNHKMNLEYDEVYNYINKINSLNIDNNLVICPTNVYLESFINNCTWGIGAQNVFYEESGNYTGEISTLQLKSLGVEYCLVGHYERKKYFGETNKIINKKLIACLEGNIQPILCFGEDGDIEKAKEDLDVLLEGVENIDFIIFAYEPLKVSKKEISEQIGMDVESIYDYLQEKYQTRPNIVYGGGVFKEDINRLLEIEKLNGILIGKISSNITKMERLLKSIN